MRLNMLSVIIPEGSGSLLTELICKNELKNQDFEIIRNSNWMDGIRKSQGEFLSFVDPDADFSNDFFQTNLLLFQDKPSFRKLAMVSSAVNVNIDHRIYGYKLVRDRDKLILMPSNEQSSSLPYKAQIGYIPGSIIRRSAITHFDLSGGNPIASSVKLSLDIWSKGSMVYVNPRTVYKLRNPSMIDSPVRLSGIPEIIKSTQRIWRQQMVG